MCLYFWHKNFHLCKILKTLLSGITGAVVQIFLFQVSWNFTFQPLTFFYTYQKPTRQPSSKQDIWQLKFLQRHCMKSTYNIIFYFCLSTRILSFFVSTVEDCKHRAHDNWQNASACQNEPNNTHWPNTAYEQKHKNIYWELELRNQKSLNHTYRLEAYQYWFLNYKVITWCKNYITRCSQNFNGS